MVYNLFKLVPLNNRKKTITVYTCIYSYADVQLMKIKILTCSEISSIVISAVSMDKTLHSILVISV